MFLIMFFVAAFFLLLLVLGYVLIKVLGMAKGVKHIYQFVSFFRRGERYDRVNTSRAQAYNKECPFCLGEPSCPVVASCNHTYCSKCILQFYVHEGKKKLDCPTCKQPINILIRNFQPKTEVQTSLKIGICQYNKSHSQQSPVALSVQESVAMLPQISRWALSREGIANLYQNGRLKTILFSLIYMMSPIDFIPEAIFGPLGLIDDSIVGLNMVRTIANHFMNYVRDRDENELRLFRQQLQQRGSHEIPQQQSHHFNNLAF